MKNIKKMLTSIIVVAIVAQSGAAYSFAAEQTTTSDQSTEIEATAETLEVAEKVGGLDFTGPVVSLTLEEALDLALTDGSTIKTAEIKRQSDLANAKSNAEESKKMYESNQESTGGIGSTSYSDVDIAATKKAKEYYTTIADRNFNAAKNSITYDVTNAYYSMLDAVEKVRISGETLELQTKLLSTVKSKFELGVASKQDVLQAEIASDNAASSLNSAAIDLVNKKISLNMELGYDDMQSVKLTSPLTAKAISELNLTQALSDAQANRNELYKAAYNVYTMQTAFYDYRYFPETAAKYLTAYSNLESAKKSYSDQEADIRLEVRMDYVNMYNNRSLAEKAKVNVEKAKESYEIYKLKYELGMAALTDTQQAQIDYADAQKSYADLILTYNMSVMSYDQSATVGKSLN